MFSPSDELRLQLYNCQFAQNHFRVTRSTNIAQYVFDNSLVSLPMHFTKWQDVNFHCLSMPTSSFSRFTIFLIISDLSVVHGPLKQFYVGFALFLRSEQGVLTSTGFEDHKTPRSARQMFYTRFFLFSGVGSVGFRSRLTGASSLHG